MKVTLRRMTPNVVLEIAWDFLTVFGIWNVFQPISVQEFFRPAVPLAVMLAMAGVLVFFRHLRLARMQKRWESVWQNPAAGAR